MLLPLSRQSSFILAWRGPTHAELRCHSLHLPIKSFSLNTPILSFHALFAVCNYIQIYCMSASMKAEALSHWLTRNIVGSAQTCVEWINVVLFLVLDEEEFTDRTCWGCLVSLGIFIPLQQIFTECYYVPRAGVTCVRKLLVTKWILEFWHSNSVFLFRA